MAIKKKISILLIGALSICLFFAFGFQIDISGGIGKIGGTADVSLSETLRVAADEANAALAEFEPGENKIMYSHIITNSNNGGSFNSESNHSGVDGGEHNFTFDSEEGYDLVWLRIGNIKIAATEDILPYLQSFNKKNLTIHAHFKKDKDYSPEITNEETDLEEDTEQGDENDDEKDNGKGKDKEKSNNGKKKKDK